MRKVIFDTDIGSDDAVALTALLLSDQVEVVGITTVHGNQPVEHTTDNALRLVSFLKKDVPVYKGCGTPMVRTLTKGRELNTRMQRVRLVENGEEITIHEKTLNLPPADRPHEKKHACSFLVDYLRAAEEPVEICAVGPLTNLGIAFRMCPEVVKKIGTIYIMGGAVAVGNRTPVAEANFYDDPEAAEIVLTSGARIVLGPAESNEIGATYTGEDIRAIEAIGNKTSAFLVDVLNGYIRRCNKLFGSDPDSCCIHDYAGIAPLLDPKTVVRSAKEICHVDISGGMADGMLVMDRRGFDTDDSSVEVVYDMDPAVIRTLLLSLVRNSI